MWVLIISAKCCNHSKSSLNKLPPSTSVMGFAFDAAFSFILSHASDKMATLGNPRSTDYMIPLKINNGKKKIKSSPHCPGAIRSIKR